MVQQGSQLGLINESLDQILFLQQMGQNFFDRNQLFKTLGAGQLGTIQLGHTAQSDLVQKLILAELFGLKYWHR